ncbi:PREDICTED: proline-rich receptor-like protein kinase PERK10 [Chinchilla lanigera]|uniref:proline-rich receptor-like protein kinase PERK10 n=1 Tax=Chinchilla lanigera TaxID=34839 RepID=UPI00038F12BA|nr:PREDICTED: proline-rich receptor-like protein kinase PERK10 [Chinchilla lanigera]
MPHRDSWGSSFLQQDNSRSHVSHSEGWRSGEPCGMGLVCTWGHAGTADMGTAEEAQPVPHCKNRLLRLREGQHLGWGSPAGRQKWPPFQVPCQLEDEPRASTAPSTPVKSATPPGAGPCPCPRGSSLPPPPPVPWPHDLPKAHGDHIPSTQNPQDSPLPSRRKPEPSRQTGPCPHPRPVSGTLGGRKCAKVTAVSSDRLQTPRQSDWIPRPRIDQQLQLPGAPLFVLASRVPQGLGVKAPREPRT